MIISSQQVIDQTRNWINNVVVGCNFCPFAARVLKQQNIHYQVETSTSLKASIDSFLREVARLDDDINNETTFLIFPSSFERFDDYLDLLSLAERSLKQSGHEGIYQVASFHPLYRFANSPNDDAANYTNRSIYPMLHLLREASIDEALANYKNPENIPHRNIAFARQKGLAYMQKLKDG